MAQLYRFVLGALLSCCACRRCLAAVEGSLLLDSNDVAGILLEDFNRANHFSDFIGPIGKRNITVEISARQTAHGGHDPAYRLAISVMA
jgi:hypothetical protein